MLAITPMAVAICTRSTTVSGTDEEHTVPGQGDRLPSLPAYNSWCEDEDFAKVIKIGSGISRDEELGRCELPLMWRGCRVDENYIEKFSHYLHTLVEKWNITEVSLGDPRVQALQTEWESNKGDKAAIYKSVCFFCEVFVKYIFSKAKLPSLTTDQILDVVETYYRLNNKAFAHKIESMLKLNTIGTTETLVNTLLMEPPQSTYTNHNGIFHHPDFSFHILKNHNSVSRLSISHPEEVQIQALYKDSTSLVRLSTTASHGSENTVGRGEKLVEFFHRNVGANFYHAFPGVRVKDDEEVKYVVALIKEKAMEFNRKHGIHQSESVKYSSDTVIAESVLPKLVVNHIRKCFTKQGMQQAKVRRQRQHQDKVRIKRNISAPEQNVIRDEDDQAVTEEHDNIENEYVDLWNVSDEIVNGCFEDEDENEAVSREFPSSMTDSIATVDIEVESGESEDEKENVPTVNEIKEELEVQLFGGILPKAKLTREPVRTGLSERVKGRGGRNEIANDVKLHDGLVMGAVDFMLHRKKNKIQGEKEVVMKFPLKLGSLFGKRKRRKKPISINFDDLSDDEDEDYIASIKRGFPLESGKRRRSGRLQEKQSRCDGEEDNREEIRVMKDVECQPLGTGLWDGGYVSASELSTCDTSEIGRQEDERFVVDDTPIVNNNYLRSRNKESSNYLKFEKVYTRKKFEKTASFALACKLRKRAERTLGRKYNGYGYKALSGADSDPGGKGIIQVDTERRNNIKSVISDEELAFIDELHRCAEKNVVHVQHNVAEHGCLDTPAKDYIDLDAILDSL